MDAQEILDDAIELLESAKHSEARRRVIANRAYYACRHFLLQHPCGSPFKATMTKKQGYHRQFIDWLFDSPEPNVQKVADKLSKLYARRCNGDYNLSAEMIMSWVEDSVNKAGEIFDVDLATYNATVDKRA